MFSGVCSTFSLVETKFIFRLTTKLLKSLDDNFAAAIAIIHCIFHLKNAAHELKKIEKRCTWKRKWTVEERKIERAWLRPMFTRLRWWIQMSIGNEMGRTKIKHSAQHWNVVSYSFFHHCFYFCLCVSQYVSAQYIASLRIKFTTMEEVLTKSSSQFR